MEMKHASILSFVFSPVLIASAAGLVLLHLGLIGRFTLMVILLIGVAVSLVNSILVIVRLSRR
jgi:undecaprenyl pyrophosphate phosphatase UppP